MREKTGGYDIRHLLFLAIYAWSKFVINLYRDPKRKAPASGLGPGFTFF